MTLEVDGVEYTRFVAAAAMVRLDTLANTFSFEATSEDGVPLPFRGGEECRVIVDGEPVVTGFIELVNVEGSGEEHRIDVQGRDRTGDLLDSSIASLSDLLAPITLATIIEKVIAHLGIADLDVVDLVGPAPFNAAEDLAAPEPGQNAFEFLEALARKRQVLLTSDGNGDIVIAQGSGVRSGAFLQNRVGDNSNNVLGYSVSYDTTGRFNAYRSVSQLNALPGALAGGLSVGAIVSQGGDTLITDQAIRAGRQLVLVSESQFSTDQNDLRARWEANIRRARGRVYGATVHGFRNQEENLWAVNTLVDVRDEFAGIEAPMLVNSVTFNQTGEEGSSTTLSLVEKNAYSIALEEPEEEKESLGSGLSLG